MQLSIFNKVSKVIKVLECVDNARRQAKDYQMSLRSEEKVSPHHIEGVTNAGYNCIVGEHSDFSGQMIELSGCYVALEITEATLIVLQEKRERIILWLEANGVDCE